MPGPDLGAVLGALLSGESARMLTAKVDAVGTGVCTISFNGGQVTSVPYLKGAAPVVGDQVYVVGQKEWGMFVLGSPAASAARAAPSTATQTWTPATLGIWRVRPSTPAGAWVVSTDGTMYVTQGDADSQVSQAAWFYTHPLTLPFTGIGKTELWVETGVIPGVDPDTGYTYIDVFLHNNLTPTTTFAPLSGEGQVRTFKVSPNNGGAWLPIPISWVSQLMAGTARGIAVATAGETLTLIDDGSIRVTAL